MFTSFHMGPYEPLPILTLAIDYAIWGADPRGFHLTTLLWHVVNAVSFYLVARRLLRVSISESVNHPLALGFCAALAALAFAVHPLRVESVAWAAGRLDVVAAFFGIWTVWAYLNAAQAHQRRVSVRWLVLSLIFFVLSLMSKGSTLFLPAALSVLDIYPLRRLRGSSWWVTDTAARHVWLEKLPYWFFTLAAAGLAVYGRTVAGAVAPLSAYGPLDRIALAGFSAVFYVWKTVLPLRLSPLYELPDEISITEPRFFLSVVAAFVITIVLALYRKRAPAALAGWVAYLILLIPVSGVAQTGAQLAADRYSYVPCLSFAVLVAGVSLLWLTARRMAAGSVATLGTVFIIGSITLGALTWRQTRLWRDSQTLWRHALQIDPNSSKALTGLACAIAEQGELQPARELLEHATRVRPRSHYAHWNLALILQRSDETERAISHYLEAWKWSPRSFEIAQALGAAYQEQEDWPNASLWYERALALRPNSTQALTGAGTVRTALGEFDRAVELLERAIQLEPSSAVAHNSLGIALRRRGKVELAAKQFLTAHQLDPSSADICYNLGYLFLQREEWAPAIEWYERALSVDPAMAKALNDLGIVHKRQGQLEQAMQYYRRAIEADPKSTDPRYNLALALAEQADDNAAIAEYARVLELDERHVSAAHNLAMLLMKNRNYSEAARVLRKGVLATNHPALEQRLAWLLATAPDSGARDGKEAVRLAEQLAQRTRSNSQVLDTLAAAYAEIGMFDLALETASRALQIAEQQDNLEQIEAIAARRESYRAGRPHRAL
jgi:tetratricopeptide (TPR) repeat protein